MAEQERLVAVPLQVEQPREADPAGVRTVELEGERPVDLPADERSAGYASILDELRQRRFPVYLEFDAESRAVSRLLIPYVSSVRRLFTLDQGVVGVELEYSHARHVLRHTTDGAERMEALLREAVERGAPLVITEDDAHSIIDVRPPGPDWQWPTPPPARPRWPWLPKFLRVPLLFLVAILGDLWWFLFPVSSAKATQVFNALNTLSCNPVNVPPPCIPFMYPDDGCWGRAHEMGRLMRGMSTSPRKVWIQGWLNVKTRNNPTCEVHWGWHVAPILRVRSWFLISRTMVVDPALFTAPVKESTWKAVQDDPNASLTHTSADIFWLWTLGTDPDNSQTEGVLATYRLKLRTRSLDVGPPPYAYCP